MFDPGCRRALGGAVAGDGDCDDGSIMSSLLGLVVPNSMPEIASCNDDRFDGTDLQLILKEKENGHRDKKTPHGGITLHSEQQGCNICMHGRFMSTYEHFMLYEHFS